MPLCMALYLRVLPSLMSLQIDSQSSSVSLDLAIVYHFIKLFYYYWELLGNMWGFLSEGNTFKRNI